LLKTENCGEAAHSPVLDAIALRRGSGCRSKEVDMIDKQIHKEIRTAIKEGDIEKFAVLLGSDKGRLYT